MRTPSPYPAVVLTHVFHSVHGANGYLIQQFLDNTANHRTDQWGGSVENRARFGLEVLKVLVEVFGRNVSIKLSPAGGYNDVGYVAHRTVVSGLVLTVY